MRIRMKDKEEDMVFQLNLVIAYLDGIAEKTEFIFAKDHSDRLIEILVYLQHKKQEE